MMSIETNVLGKWMYKISISNRASKELDNFPDKIFLRIDDTIQSLKTNARPMG